MSKSAPSLLDKVSQLAPTSQGNYAYYGKEQIILPQDINSPSINPALTKMDKPFEEDMNDPNRIFLSASRH
jgi:hypothetical protein